MSIKPLQATAKGGPRLSGKPSGSIHAEVVVEYRWEVTT